MSLQGTFDVFSLPELLRMLASAHKSGALVVDSPGGGSRIDLRDGECIAAESVALRGALASGAELHDRLVELCFAITREREGAFRFGAGDSPAFECESTVPIEPVLAEVGLLAAEWDELTALVPSLDARPTLAPDLADDAITLSAEEWRVVARSDGHTSLRDLAGGRARSLVDVCRVVTGLAGRGALRLDAPSGVVLSSSAPDTVDHNDDDRDHAGDHETPVGPPAVALVMPVEPYGPGVEQDEPAAAAATAPGAELEPAVVGAAVPTSLGEIIDDREPSDRGAILKLFSALREA